MIDADLVTKALVVRAPNDVGATANEFGQLSFTVPTAHRADPLPAAWRGQRFVIIQHTSGPEFQCAFSTNSGAEIDTAVAATNTGASGKVGAVVRVGGDLHVMLPAWGDAQTMYFVREANSSGAATCIIGLGDYSEHPVSLALPFT